MPQLTLSERPIGVDAPVGIYKAKAEAGGFRKRSTMNVSGTQMFGAEDAQGYRIIAVQASIQDGKTAAIVNAAVKGS